MLYTCCSPHPTRSMLDRLTVVEFDRQAARAEEADSGSAIVYVFGENDVRCDFAGLYPALVTPTPIEFPWVERVVH